MTKKTSCHLPFNVERGELERKEGTVIKTVIKTGIFGSADTIPLMTSDYDTDNSLELYG